MKLSVKNLGIIKSGEIELNGLTVIAGQNGLGKSTLGKMLFCILNSYYDADASIREERIRQVNSLLNQHGSGETVFGKSPLYFIPTARKIVDNYEENQELLFPEGVLELFENAERRPLYNLIKETLEIQPSVILQSLLKRRLDEEFGGQITPVNYPRRKTSVVLEASASNKLTLIKEHKKEADVILNGIIKCDSIYMDDPYILDHLSNRGSGLISGRFSHRGDLLNKLLRNTDQESVISHILAKRNWEELSSLISLMCEGELKNTSGIEYAYSSSKYRESLNLENLSTGLKSILLLKTLIGNGCLNHKTVMIFDEPEVHLHPEWQFHLARIMVLLPKVLDVFILVNTHSSDFLSAIDFYTRNYEMMERTNYYLIKGTDEYSVVSDVTKRIDAIYNELSAPFLRVADQL